LYLRPLRFLLFHFNESPSQTGKDPIHFLIRSGRITSMRHKTGNGNTVDLQKFMEDIKTVVHDGEELLKVGARELKGKAISGAKSTDRVVRDHPYHTLGLMLGIGLFIGLLATGAFSGGGEH